MFWYKHVSFNRWDLLVLKYYLLFFCLGGWRKEQGMMVNGQRESFWGDENVLNMDGGGSLTVNLLKTVAFYT